ncbi:MAG: ABC transporter permease [Chloroflexi bacterium]|nr:ABC transporter permease [Chloroflexota bacterium]
MSILNPSFLTELNIFNVLRGMSTIGIMSIGVTMVIVTGGIDLSIGSILAAASIMTARLMFTEVTDPWTAVLLGLTFGGALGLVNGLVITKLKVNPFITTLGMMTIARGITYLLASGLQGTVASNVPMRHEGVSFLGNGYVFQHTAILERGIPFPVILMFTLVIVFSLFLRYTVLGRQIYAVGSNEAAARLSGVPADRVKLFVYTLTGILAALAGIMTAGLLRTAATNAGVGVELDVIAAVVIGGASLVGGEGTILGAIIGAAIIAVVQNAFVLLKIPNYAQQVTIGAVIIAAVAADRWRRRNR